MAFVFRRAFGFTSLLPISLLIYLPPLLSTLLYCTPLIILSLKTKKLITENYCNFWVFASLLCFLLVVPPGLVLLFSSLLLPLVLLVLQSHLLLFLCPLDLPLFRILLLHVSGLLLSFYTVCIFFLPLLSSIPLFWSRFHIYINLANIFLSFHFILPSK